MKWISYLLNRGLHHARQMFDETIDVKKGNNVRMIASHILFIAKAYYLDRDRCRFEMPAQH